jgi:SNF2 family DNA or RNA helicase
MWQILDRKELLAKLRESQKYLEKMESVQIEKGPQMIKDASNLTELPIINLVFKYGTKMGSVLKYLDNLLITNTEARVIIFSHITPFLQHIGKVLKQFNINNTFVHGNVHIRNKAINEFKDNKLRVLLMSLEFSASGTNLVEASHIFILSPSTGTKKQIAAKEAQAIGRAARMGQSGKLTVVRFVMLSTPEQSLYENTFGPIDGQSLNRSSLIRSSSFITEASNNPSLSRSGSFPDV